MQPDQLITTARDPEEAKQKRAKLEEMMFEAGLFPELLIGPVPRARPDDAAGWGVWYRPPQENTEDSKRKKQ